MNRLLMQDLNYDLFHPFHRRDDVELPPESIPWLRTIGPNRLNGLTGR